MKYLVRVPPQLVDHLAALLSKAITDGYDSDFADSLQRIQGALEVNPHECGESRSGDIRIVFELPAAVEFIINESSREVLVTAIGYHPRRLK